MKLITIEQVDNGYIVSNKLECGGFDPACLPDKSGIHVFQTFASMSKWLEGHFERDEEPAITHFGDDAL